MIQLHNVVSVGLLEKAMTLLKMAANQPRNAHGEWTSGSTSVKLPAAAPVSAPVPTDAAYWSQATKTGGQLGSNAGGVYHGPDGEKYYVKFYSNPAQAKAEVVAQRVYKAAGLAVPTGAEVEVGGMKAVANRWTEGNTQLDGPALHKELMSNPAEAGRIFMASVATQNWDVVGTGYDNLVKTASGRLMNVDTGGVFTFRAQGGTKPYSSAAGEMKTFLDPGKNAYSAVAFKDIWQHPEARQSAYTTAVTLRDHAAILGRAPGITPAQFRAKMDDAIVQLKAMPGGNLLKSIDGISLQDLVDGRTDYTPPPLYPDVKAAGLAVIAADTGRVLMLQRGLTEGDKNGGLWELPGGKLDPGEDPYTAARREWHEEVGAILPEGEPAGSWTSPNGVYCGYTYVIPHETDVHTNPDQENRHTINPDDPDGDVVETVAWWDIHHLPFMTALRPEVRTTPWNILLAAPQEVLDYQQRQGMFSSAEKDISLSSPLSTGLVPFDLDGQHPRRKLTEEGEEEDLTKAADDDEEDDSYTDGSSEDSDDPTPDERDTARNALLLSIVAFVVARFVVLGRRVQNGSLTQAAFLDAAQGVLEEAYGQAFKSGIAQYQMDAGLHDTATLTELELTAPQRQVITSLVDRQVPYLDGFAKALEDVKTAPLAAAGAGEAATATVEAVSEAQLAQRAKLYADSTTGAYEHGYVAAASKHIPDVRFVWHARLGACPECKSRDGQHYTLESLPSYPGDGDCSGGNACRCVVEVLHP